MKQTKLCERCSVSFEKPVNLSVVRWGKRRYCSQKCTGAAQVGHAPPRSAFKIGFTPWNKGNHTQLNDALEKWQARGGGIGERNANWKGEDAGYGPKHQWVSRHKKRTGICSDCGKKGDAYHIHWSNIDHQYLRKLDDYVERCAPCHKKYDLSNGLCTN